MHAKIQVESQCRLADVSRGYVWSSSIKCSWLTWVFLLCVSLLHTECVQVRPGMDEGHRMVDRGFCGSDESEECSESFEWKIVSYKARGLQIHQHCWHSGSGPGEDQCPADQSGKLVWLCFQDKFQSRGIQTVNFRLPIITGSKIWGTAESRSSEAVPVFVTSWVKTTASKLWHTF